MEWHLYVEGFPACRVSSNYRHRIQEHDHPGRRQSGNECGGVRRLRYGEVVNDGEVIDGRHASRRRRRVGCPLGEYKTIQPVGM